MSRRTRTFRRPDTGEAKEFTEDSYRYDTITMHSTHREFAEFDFYRAANGDRIDRQPDGSYRDEWGVVWVPQ
jgi:hypothetical protein